MFVLSDAAIDKLPSALPSFVYTAIIYWIVNRVQGSELTLHKESQRKSYSSWRAAGVGIISLLVNASGAFITGDLSKQSFNFEAAKHYSRLEKFIENEAKALLVFNHLEAGGQDSFDQGIQGWISLVGRK
ncbi:MAG: hypothetical protein GY755_19930 [Chloroflexi bacterium]|nr:hypothetical protein [Chloroflexota bacterium]